MVRKVQVPVVGGIRKVIQVGGGNTAVGTTIQEFGSAVVSLAQLKVALGIVTPAAGSGNGAGAVASLTPGPGLVGGGPVIGNVPLRLLQLTPPVVWNEALLPDDWIGSGGGGGSAGGTASPLTTKGDVYVFGTSNTRLGVGSDGQVLTARASATNGLDWEAVSNSSLVYTNTSVPAGNTVANTVTATSFASTYNIAANTLSVGAAIRVTLRGVYSTAVAAPTISVALKLGSTTVLATGSVSPLAASASNDGWSYEALLIVQTTGATGTVEAQGTSIWQTAASTSAVQPLENTAPITIDTTVTQAVTVVVTWGTASASNTITLREMAIWIEGIAAAPSGGSSSANITPDTHPAIATAWDDEFEGATLDPKWTWINQGSNTATLAAGSLILTTTNGTQDNNSGIVQSISGTFDVSAKIASTAYNVDARANMYVGLGGSGKLYSFGWYRNSGTPEFYVNAYPSPTGSTASSTLFAGAGIETVGGRMWFYYRIKYDGTNIVFYISLNGVVWNQLQSVTAASYLGSAPSAVGLSTSCSLITVTAGLPAIVDWFRRTA